MNTTPVSYDTRFDIPFFTGLPEAAPLVPSLWQVALAGHTYMIDQRQINLFTHDSIPHQRPNFAFTNSAIGERALNPDAGWRVSGSSWHHGAGQEHYDLTGLSDQNRFNSSKGMDVWTRWRLGMLNDTYLIRGSANANLSCLSVGVYMYAADGTEVYWSSDLGTWTASNITAGGHNVTSITTDGFTVYAACGASGVQKTSKAATSSSNQNVQACTLVKWIKGRLIAANGPSLYVIPTASGAATTAPAAFFTHDNADWTWVGFTEGPQAIYCAGFSGDRAEVYSIPIKSDGSGLNQPISSATIPPGEGIYSVSSYLGFVLIGTGLGVRVATPGTTTDLSVGPLVQTNQPVRSFIGYGRFVWFGWETFDSTSSGLGRIDLTTFNDIAPAYASDLMGPSGQVSAIASFGNRRVFAIPSVGIYAEAAYPVQTSYLTTGELSYDIADAKLAIAVSARHVSFAGTHDISLSADDNAYVDLGNVTYNGNLPAQQTRAEMLQLKHTFTTTTLSGSSIGSGPILRRWTLVSLPAPRSAQKITVPLQLWETNQTQGGQDYNMSVPAEFDFLTGLRDSRQVFAYQEGGRQYTVTLTDFKWLPSSRVTSDYSFWDGTMVVMLTTVDTS